MSIDFTRNELNDYQAPSHNELVDILVTLHSTDMLATTSFYQSVRNRMIPFEWDHLPKSVLDNGLWWHLVDYCFDSRLKYSRWHFKRVSGAPYSNIQEFIWKFQSATGIKVNVCSREAKC